MLISLFAANVLSLIVSFLTILLGSTGDFYATIASHPYWTHLRTTLF